MKRKWILVALAGSAALAVAGLIFFLPARTPAEPAQTAPAGDLDTAEARRVGDHQPLGAKSGKHARELLVGRDDRQRRLGRCANRLRIGIGLDQAAIP